jgi:hypothetical protein
MSTRRYCDICEKQLGRNVVSQRFRPSFFRRYTNWHAEVMIRKGSTWNTGDMCLDCLRELLNESFEWDERWVA